MSTIELSLQRAPSKLETTLGTLTHGSEKICDTLEDQVREIPGRPVKNWKIPGRTAIPSGRYRITLEYSPRFGSDTITVNNVEYFSGVRGHGGNRHTNTEGCLLFGTKLNDTTIINSQAALKVVKDRIKAFIATGHEVWLTIHNAKEI